jgi:hypothetical protein
MQAAWKYDWSAAVLLNSLFLCPSFAIDILHQTSRQTKQKMVDKSTQNLQDVAEQQNTEATCLLH